VSSHTSRLSSAHFSSKSTCVSHKLAIISVSSWKLQAGDATDKGLRLYQMLVPHRVGKNPTTGIICCYFRVALEMSLILSALVTSDQGKGRGHVDSKAGWEAPY